MIDRLTLFETWAPAGETWAAWAKPVLFAHWPRELPRLEPLAESDVSWAPPISHQKALIIEIRGDEAVAMGLSLAKAGYRPVPIFNGAPPPVGPRHPREPIAESTGVVDVEAILFELVHGVERLRAIKIPNDAPPAFLIDELRSTPSRPILEGAFDNRSWIYTTDFPSADAFRNRGIRSLIVFRGACRGPIAADLEHLLRVWAKAGLEIGEIRAETPGVPVPLRLRQPSIIAGLRLWLRRLFVDPIHGHGSIVRGSSG